MVAGRGPKIKFALNIERGIEFRRNWAWERVLINLFSNAVRAMPKGGVIHIRASKDEHTVEIVVRDEGPGIAPEILDHIFKPGVSTKASNKGSSGLGLHIVETIIKQEDGDIRAANCADGRGAEFTITIPVDAGAGVSFGRSISASR
jgi:two-component system NtrC family sensor kinase